VSSSPFHQKFGCSGTLKDLMARVSESRLLPLRRGNGNLRLEPLNGWAFSDHPLDAAHCMRKKTANDIINSI